MGEHRGWQWKLIQENWWEGGEWGGEWRTLGGEVGRRERKWGGKREGEKGEGKGLERKDKERV